MSDKPKKQVKPAVAVEPAAPTPPERPAAKAEAKGDACPVCGTAMPGNRCEVDGYQRADI